MSGDSASQRRAIRSGEYRIPGCNDADAVLKRPTPKGQRCSLPARIRGCARTAWHSHTIAQTLYVTVGQELVQARGVAVTRIRRGDAVNVDGGEWPWHGAAPGRVMTHLSLTEGDTGWGDHVTDAEYARLVRVATSPPPSQEGRPADRMRHLITDERSGNDAADSDRDPPLF